MTVSIASHDKQVIGKNSSYELLCGWLCGLFTWLHVELLIAPQANSTAAPSVGTMWRRKIQDSDDLWMWINAYILIYINVWGISLF